MNKLVTAVIGGGALALSAVARLFFDVMNTSPTATAVFLVRSNSSFWQQFHKCDCIVVKNIDKNVTSFEFKFQVKQDAVSYKAFIDQCVDNRKLGMVFYENLEEVVKELSPYTHTFSTCCGSAFRDVVEQIAKGHQEGDQFEIVGFENNHSNTIDSFPCLKEKYPRMGISFALCDCIAGNRRIVENEIWIDAESESTIYALEYEGVSFSYGLPSNMGKVSSEDKILIMSNRKESNLNLPHAMMSYLKLYSLAGSLKYEAVKPYENELVKTAFDVFDMDYATLFALFFIKREESIKESEAKALFETTILYCQDNVKRFCDNYKDVIGRVVHLKNKKNYLEKMGKIRRLVNDMCHLVSSPETKNFITRNGLNDINYERCCQIAENFNKVLNPVNGIEL